MSDLLTAQNLSFAYTATPALANVNLTCAPGRLLAILGPNGSGKSTLLKVLLGHLPTTGSISWISRPISDWRRRDLARLIAYLPQSPTWDSSQTVNDSLRLGRAPYWGALGLESPDDHRTVLETAELLDLSDLLHRRMDQLSGGQRQRVLLGRCLVQQPRAMLLDEPDTFLDLKHQLELCQLLRTLAKDRGMAILMASHDLNLASSFADEVIVLHNGAIAIHGSPAEALQPDALEKIYGIPMDRITRAGGAPLLFPRAQSPNPHTMSDHSPPPR